MARPDPFGDPDSIAHSLDFSHGHHFRAKVHELFSTPVNPISPSGHFFLVASFGRFGFRLDELNVCLALSSCLGCAFEEIYITKLSERVFRFSVCSKAVGFLIHNFKHFSCPRFVCYFHLWGNGGPNWQREFSRWHSEQEAKWSSGSRSRLRSRPHSGCDRGIQNSVPVRQSFARIHNAIDQRPSVLTGANLVPLGNRSNPLPSPDPVSSAIPSSFWTVTHFLGGISGNLNSLS
jgi:hypothetical protein